MYFYDLLIIILSILFLIIFVLISVAFLTLIERKVLGYIQIRKGPNKIGLLGVLQPFRDAIKLFSKEQTFPYMSNFYIYYFSPVINLLISLFLWLSIPFLSWFLNFNFSILFFLCISRIGVYRIIIAGWSSNRNFSLLGSLRCIAQSISYEVRLSLILISLVFLTLTLNFIDIIKFQYYIIFLFLILPLFFIWFVSCLAETNRTPFDFAEGESELVSGFNVEYRRGGFALIFLAEYSNIIFISLITCILFLRRSIFSLIFFFKASFLVFLFVLIRGTLPRFRYDKLIYLAWKSFLPVSLNYIIVFFSLKLIIIIFFI